MRLLLILSWLLLAAPALAQQAVAVRLGSHPGFGRVVFDLPAAIPFTVERAGHAVTLHFPGAGDVPAPPGAARNVSSFSGGHDTAVVTVAPGVRLRTMRLGSRVVVDVLDPAPDKPAGPPRAKPVEHAAAAAAKPPDPPPPAPVAAPKPEPAAIVVPPPEPAPAATPAAPVALAALPVADDASRTVLLPFDQKTGAAAFRHGRETWVVFDERRAIDLADTDHDPVFSGAAIQLLQAATLLRLQSPGAVQLVRHPGGWSVSAAGSAAIPLSPAAKQQRILFAAAEPGQTPSQVVVVPDPDTGQNLLVGTLQALSPADRSRGVPVAYRVPEFTVLPSWQGVVVEPISDRTVLRPVPEGFAIETGGPLSAPPASARALEAGAALTRRFDFPAEAAESLLQRLQMQVQAQGDAPPQARLAPRKAAAQTMLALGLASEAQALLRLALAEDPRGAEDPDLIGLAGVAALLAGRPAEADGLLAPDPAGTDEAALWRAARAATLQEGAPDAAPVFAATAGLVLSYPAALRNALLPLVAETMAEGGAPDAADALLAKLPDEPRLTFARAMRLEAKGDSAAALAVYDSLATGRDRFAATRAATRATLLRRSTGAIGPADAADQLEHRFLSWRGDARERDARIQAATLRAQAGQWRPAFNLLRETAPLYPGDRALLQSRTAGLLNDLLRGPAAATMPPMELVELADENAEAVAQADPMAVSSLLADKLAALDLPRRAEPILQRMAAAAPAGAGKAALGARLATMRLGEGNVSGAGAALADTTAPGLPPDMMEQRGLLTARVQVRAHDTAGAVATLASIATVAADDMRAAILGEAGDWTGSAAALASLATRTVPPDGPLGPAQQDTLLRLASAQAHAGQDDALHALGTREAARMAGPKSDMFRLLTAAPVTGVGDLRRAAGEVTLARTVPAALASMGTR